MMNKAQSVAILANRRKIPELVLREVVYRHCGARRNGLKYSSKTLSDKALDFLHNALQGKLKIRPDWEEQYEERAAIFEYDGAIERSAAEFAAYVVTHWEGL